MKENPAVPPRAARRSREVETARIGGQALIEGVMFRGSRHWSLAVRRPDGSIHSQVEPLRSFLVRHPSWDRPFLRGFFILGESLVLGWKALSLSADLALEGDGEGDGGLGALQKAASFLLALALAVGIFIALPTWLAPRILGPGTPVWAWNLLEGGMRVAFFVLYLLLVSLSRDMRRVFQYHGAEHQSIHLLEHGYPLKPEFALHEGTDHLRCGTSFVLLVLVLTVVVYSLLGRPALWIRVLERVAVIPLVAGISYEIMRYAGENRSPWLAPLVAPGLALQRLTTRRPGRDQAEVALAALRALLERERDSEGEIHDLPGEA
ncbi:DUF1385 domain-containing protein [Candidatus Solincola sp.]|jgi:uncharacterized protein YqhQ|nr:DUF1385 domain-containing protein [Actinomycetota bacterium]